MELIKVFKQKCSQSATNGANKKAKELELVYIDYQPDKTRMIAVYEVTLFVMNIKPTWARGISKNVTIHLTA